MWRGLSHEFRVVRLYRTFSIYIIAGETRCAGCLCTSSGLFKHIEPHRTYLNHNTTEIARCGEVCHMSSGWFECKVLRGLSHKFGVVRHDLGVVRLYRTFSIYIIAGETRCAMCLCTSSGLFKHIEPHQTYLNHNTTEKIARCGEV